MVSRLIGVSQAQRWRTLSRRCANSSKMLRPRLERRCVDFCCDSLFFLLNTCFSMILYTCYFRNFCVKFLPCDAQSETCVCVMCLLFVTYHFLQRRKSHDYILIRHSVAVTGRMHDLTRLQRCQYGRFLEVHSRLLRFSIARHRHGKTHTCRGLSQRRRCGVE